MVNLVTVERRRWEQLGGSISPGYRASSQVFGEKEKFAEEIREKKRK